jgi:hypothetical protein
MSGRQTYKLSEYNAFFNSVWYSGVYYMANTDIRKQLAIITLIICTGLVMACSGCICSNTTAGGSATPTVAPTAVPTAMPVASPTGGNGATPAAGGNVPDVSSIGENMVVKGTGNGDAKVYLKAGGYVAYSAARSTLQLQEVTSAGASSLYPDGMVPDRSGWLTALKIINVNESGDTTFRVICNGNYEIRFNRLPSSDRQYLPWTNYGKGTSCTSPVEITASSVTLSINCKDTLKGPFKAYLVDGSSGEYFDTLLNTNDASVNVTMTISIPKPGIYNVQVDSMSGTDWTVIFSK